MHQLELKGIRYPFLVKPAWADGRPGSHALAVVGSDAGLEQLIEGEPAQQISLPVLVQEYVEHGGCLFKVTWEALCSTVKCRRAALSAGMAGSCIILNSDVDTRHHHLATSCMLPSDPGPWQQGANSAALATSCIRMM